MARERTHGFLVDAGFNERMAHAVVLCRVKARAVFAEIVEVRTGDDLCGRMGHQRAIQVGLAVEAAVDRVAAIVGIAELPGVDYRQHPALPRCKGAYAIGGFLRHGGRNRVEHFGFAARSAMSDCRQREAVPAAAYRDRNASDVAQDAFPFREGVLDVAHLRSLRNTTCSASRCRRSRSARPPITFSRSSASPLPVSLPGRCATLIRICRPAASTVVLARASLPRCMT